MYVIAQAATVQQGPFSIPGPPPGHQDFNPSFTPYIGYAESVDTVSVIATTIVPDGRTMIEICRTTLSPGQTNLGAIDTSHQVQASSVLAPTGVVSGGYGPTVSVAVGADGRVTSIANEGLPATGVKAQAYAYPVSLTVQADGRVTSVTQGNVVNAGNAPGVSNPGHAISLGWDEARLVAAVDGQLQGVVGARVNMLPFGQPGTFTWTVPAGVTTAKVRVVGGGAGSGAAGSGGAGGGGGSGGYAEAIVAVTPGAEITITVGAGGTAGLGSGTGTGGFGGPSSFGNLLQANGGVSGLGNTPSPEGGPGGSSSADSSVAGALLVTGGCGTDGAFQSNLFGGQGGASFFGGGGRAAIGGGGASQQIGQAPGSGAGGAYGWVSGTAFNGAAGAPGCVVIEF